MSSPIDTASRTSGGVGAVEIERLRFLPGTCARSGYDADMDEKPRTGGLKRIGLAFGGLVLIVMLAFGYLLASFNSPPFPLDRLDDLTTEMTTEEVRSVLGAPSSSWIRTAEEGGEYEEWAYSRRFSWPIVYVYFDRDGRFESHRYDY